MTDDYIDANVIEDSADSRVTGSPSESGYTEVCPECSREFTAKTELAARGALGRHRKATHGPDASGPKSRGSRPPVRDDQPMPVQVLKTAANEIPDRKGAPTERDLTKAFGKGIGTLSVLAASYAAETDATIQTEADRDAVTDYLSLSPEASQEIAYPFAKAFGKSRLNKKYGRGIVDNIDIVSAGAELVNYAIRWRRYMAERRRRDAMMHPVAPPPMNGNVSGTEGNAPPVYYPPPGMGEPAVGYAGVGAMNGHVVSAEEVERMRRRNEQ